MRNRVVQVSEKSQAPGPFLLGFYADSRNVQRMREAFTRFSDRFLLGVFRLSFSAP